MYYEARPQTPSKPVVFHLKWKDTRFTFTTDAGVFSKGELDPGTRLLLTALPLPLQGSLLDLGCGWGPVGVIAGKLSPGASITMCDINERAVALAKQNLLANGVKAEVFCTDGTKGLQNSYSVIALNPPIRSGKETVYRLFREAKDSLEKGGALYIVMRKQQGAPSAKKYLQTLFDSVETVARKGGYHVFCCKGENQ
jgi:16S rRNA (guanine1207-N2)-methyltransferase